ncbi:hypothetical protein BD410DRAFT_881473 [Rickenella mellea]|uniref:F-box domain-containing protein n=1 Tax=Rickenella mellea TaxID=50990 RepID=A0A4Y7PS96_9AGAM|nr:hypothetical protein BD410DRAFT_881473 [Rickenella mellea]
MDPHIPSEIWRIIFNFATFTVTCLNTRDWAPYWPHSRFCQFSSPPPYYNVTLKTKKALVLVSRHFRDNSIGFMFEVVQLFDTHHAQLLSDTMHSHSSYPAKWIKSIIIVLDQKEDIEVMDATLIRILPHCTNLNAFGWESPHLLQSSRSEGIRDKSSELLKCIPLGITILGWKRTSLGESFNCLRIHGSLRQIRLRQVLPIIFGDTAVTIPSITHLEVRETSTCASLSSWNLPSLSHLTIDWITGIQFGPLWNTIRSISITDRRAGRPDILPGIITRLPNLESLAYHIEVQMAGRKLEKSWLGVPNHRSLTDIYIYCHAPIGSQKDEPLCTVRELFSCHLHPIMIGSLSLLRNVHILNTRVVAEVPGCEEDLRTDGVKFFSNLSKLMSTPAVQVAFQT